jgi:DNA-binding FrmR family transcriptional regulator
VSPTVRNESKVLNRVRRIRTQFEALQQELDADIDRATILQLIGVARGAIDGLMGDVIEDHVRMHVIDPAWESDAERCRAAEVLIEVIRLRFR